MAGPYRNSTIPWLEEHETFFRELLATAGKHAEQLKKLEGAFSPSGGHLLDFAGITQGEFERALSVCEKLMKELGPTAQAMRDELEGRRKL